MNDSLKDTLNLPQTDFPMRANLVEQEPARVANWKDSGLYHAIQKKNQGGKPFILHDGPPFTNGSIHIGTSLNKILKDAILKFKSMQGFRAPFLPGWDCHGLPIEHKVSEEITKNKEKNLSIPDIRRRCEAFSKKFMAIQRDQFIRLGVLADWENEYRTLDPEYEAHVIRTCATFVEQDLVYRSKKPVYWSIPCTTALAEFEIEYKDIISPSIYVKFAFVDAKKLHIRDQASFVIWTTTPWTLPANLAIALNPDIYYQEIHHHDETFIVAEKLADNFIHQCKLEGAKKGKIHQGHMFEHMETRHPFIDRPSLIVLGEHVTTESGTGCVHTAPGHGPDDYIVGQKYNLEVYSPINDYGKYINDGKIPERLVNKSVLTKNNVCPANEEVIAILKETGALLSFANYSHSYPHCWRSKTPVIFRAMDQWFVALDRHKTRETVLQTIEEVEWIPSWGKNRIKGSVESRPDWCISRQRSWGIPIIAFYDEHNNPLLDPTIIRKIADKVAKHGSNIWFEQTVEELLQGLPIPSDFAHAQLSKGTDTLEVWIDSGTSHEAVLKQDPNLAFPADLYLEGSDQHRGWFQSSLWTSCILNGKAPFKQVVTHGFVVNEERKKISKSDPNTKTVDEYVNKYGVDILRLWISSEDFRNDMPISDSILGHIVQTYRTLRNTLRFQLGNLYDFDFKKNEVKVEDMLPVDKWALHKLGEFIEESTAAFENFEFHKAYQAISRFCSVTLSATYHDILKDRLYTFGPDWQERRSAQTVIYHTFNALVRILSPILAFTADEAWSFFVKDQTSVHLESWPVAGKDWSNPELALEIERVFEVRNLVNERLEKLRQDKVLGQSLDAQVIISGGKNEDNFKLLEKFKDHLSEFFIVSVVELIPNDDIKLDVLVKHAEGRRCPRSWRWVPELVHLDGFGDLSPRCRDALLSKYPKN